MDLWIRSQDKRILMKVDNLYLNANYDNKRICVYEGDDIETNLGEYDSKERALEVLDEIQKLLNPIYKVKNEFKKSELTGNCNWEQDMVYIPIQTKVYEMPKE